MELGLVNINIVVMISSTEEDYPIRKVIANNVFIKGINKYFILK